MVMPTRMNMNMMLGRRTLLHSTSSLDRKQLWVSLYLSLFWFHLFCAEMERSIAMGPVDFVSSLGGLFGLFLGFSIISFCEIAYWAFVQFGRNIIQS